MVFDEAACGLRVVRWLAVIDGLDPVVDKDRVLLLRMLYCWKPKNLWALLVELLQAGTTRCSKGVVSKMLPSPASAFLCQTIVCFMILVPAPPCHFKIFRVG